jgi:hypothetical protein
VVERTATRLGVSYFGNRYPHHAREDLHAIAETGATFVVHVMSEADVRWNPGTMADVIGIGRELGLQPWLTPWGYGGVFGGESASYAVGEHPEACQRTSDGRHLPALCPRQPVFRSVMTDWLDASAAAGAEVVQWDELHLAMPYQGGEGPWSCRCDACQEAFRARFGEAMPESVTPEVAAFLDDLIVDTLTWLVDSASQRGLQSSIVMLADASYDPVLWRTAAALPGVQYFGSTAFWLFYGIPATEMAGYLSSWADRILDATAGTQAAPLGWVQGFKVPAGREPEIEWAVEAFVGYGVTTIAVWAYLACAAMSELAADNPAAAWDAVVRAFDKAGEPSQSAG